MKTAARMESTGLPGRIQISRSTRDYLVKAGKERLVTEREDEVLAKGLGKVRLAGPIISTSS
jgi:class 3 adenylate cyclase